MSDEEFNWIDVDGPIYSHMPVGFTRLALYTRDGLQIIENIEPPYSFESRENDRWTRIRFARPTMTLNEIVRTIVWKP